jgi:transposase
MNYMGIDHHKQYSQMTLMDEHGKELKNERVWNIRSEVEKFLQGAGDEVKAVIEAGRSSYVMVDLLEEFGVDVKIANPKEVKAIAKAKIKTDKRDSRILAHLLRADLIPEVYQRLGENRRIQRVLRQRAFFVGTMTRVKNKIRVLLAQQKEEIQEEASRVKNLFSRKGLEVLKGLDLPDTDRELLDGLLKMYHQLEERVKESDELVESLYNKMPEARLISTVPGFGKFFSVLVATEIADIGRFSRVEKLHSYAGVIPSTYSSAEKVYHGKIIKEGNKWLRWAAVEAVWPAVKSDFDLRLFFNKHAKRKSINAAKVATARRLLTIIYRILKEGRCYVPYKR